MYKFLIKHGTGAAFGLGLLVALIGLVPVIAGFGGFSGLPDDQQKATGIFDTALYATFVLFLISVIILIGFGAVQIFSHPKHSLHFFGAVVVLLILGFLSYSLSHVETSGKVYEAIQRGDLSAGMSKILNGALWTTIVLAILAVFGILVSEIRNLFK